LYDFAESGARFFSRGADVIVNQIKQGKILLRGGVASVYGG